MAKKTHLWNRRSPGLFAWGERGTLKLSCIRHGSAKRRHGREELKQDCADSNRHFPQTIQRPGVAHFCERKPPLFERHTYLRLFTITRLEHYRRKLGELGARHVLAGNPIADCKTLLATVSNEGHVFLS